MEMEEDDDDDEEIDDMEDDSSNPRTKKSGMPHKKTVGRSYVLGDNGVYERIIRKRKRKSSE
jgi:hypothetical protein